MSAVSLDQPHPPRPYPKELESRQRLPDGTEIELRPIRSDDEPLLHELAAHMTPEDLRLRFFTPIHDLPQSLAARLTRLDYGREMALVALHQGVVLGVARYAAEPNTPEAEYAIAVRSDWKARGLGYLLMTRLIEAARRYGVARLSGLVLRENRPMLAMCRELGFAVVPHPTDRGVVRVSKPLV